MRLPGNPADATQPGFAAKAITYVRGGAPNPSLPVLVLRNGQQDLPEAIRRAFEPDIPVRAVVPSSAAFAGVAITTANQIRGSSPIDPAVPRQPGDRRRMRRQVDEGFGRGSTTPAAASGCPPAIIDADLEGHGPRRAGPGAGGVGRARLLVRVGRRDRPGDSGSSPRRRAT